MNNFMRTASGIALAVASGMLATNAMAADLGGNCCTDLEERVAELEATTVRKGNRKVSVQLYGQVSEAVIWWNDGAESNTYVAENNAIQNRLGVQGSAKITSDWSAGYKLEWQIRAYRSSQQNQLAFGASNGFTFPNYNTQSLSIREANWYLNSNTYGRITVGRTSQAIVGTHSINLVNPDGFSGPNHQLVSGYFLRRAGTTGNSGLSALTWGTGAFIRSGDGPVSFDHATSASVVKYTSPFFLGHTKSSGFQFSTDWGMDDVWSVALRYAEEFGAFRLAAGVGYLQSTGFWTSQCTTGASGNSGNDLAIGGAAAGNPRTDLGSTIDCSQLTASASLLHIPTGLYMSGGWGQISDKNNSAGVVARAANQFGVSGSHEAWWIQAGWQAKLNPLGSTIFWGQYQEYNMGGGVANNLVQTLSATDPLVAGTGLGTSIIRSTTTQVWGGGITQNIDAAAMSLYAGFYNFSTESVLGSTATAARGKSNPIDDMQVFYTGATIRF